MAQLTKSQQLLYEIIKRADGIEDKTKLAKLQYLADFIHYAFNNDNISGETSIYTRQHQGPLNRYLSYDLMILEEQKLIIEKPKYHYKILKSIRTSLDKREIRTIDYVLKKYKDLSYNELIDLSHNQAPYLSSRDGEIIENITAYNLIEDYPDYAAK